jgi:hypothetical protein
MEEIYYIFNTKLGAWVGANDPYTSDVTKAREFIRSAAIKFCRSRLDFVIPVRQDDVIAVRSRP